MNDNIKPGHNISMVAIEVNRMLSRFHSQCLPIISLEAAIIKGLWSPDGPPDEHKLATLMVEIPAIMKCTKRALDLLDERQGEIRKIQELRSELYQFNLDNWGGENEKQR